MSQVWIHSYPKVSTIKVLATELPRLSVENWKKCQTHNNENTCHLLIHQSESNQVLFTSGRSPQRSAMHRRSSEHEGVSMAPQAPCYLAPDLFLTIIEHKCIGTPCNCGLHASATWELPGNLVKTWTPGLCHRASATKCRARSRLLHTHSRQRECPGLLYYPLVALFSIIFLFKLLHIYLCFPQ